MRSIARKGKFACAFLTVIVSGSFFTRVLFADDGPKGVSARDEQPKKLGTAATETRGQSDSASSETSAPQEPKRRALNELVSVRPEVRYEHAFSARPWDNGTRKGQLMFAMDALLHF